MRNPIFLVLCICLFSSPVLAQTSLSLNTIVSQNFNSIGNTATAALPANWKFSSAGTGLTSGWNTGTNITATTQAASSGLPATGGAYNWATTAGTDRAIGFLTTASYGSPNAIMAYYRNTTGGSVSSVTIAYGIERYVINTVVPTVDLYYSTNGVSWTLVNGASTTASDFPSGAAAGSFSTPKTINKAATIAVSLANNSDIYFRWVFTTSSANAQGLGLDNVSVFAGTATPVITATLQDLLQVDNGTPNQFNEGDVIRYKTVVKNSGTGDATGVQVTLPTPPANTTMVAGSVKTSAIAVDDNYTASFNTTLSVSAAGSGVLNNDIGIPLPTAVLSYGTTADATALAPGVAGTTDAGGTITLAANGTFIYTPPPNFSGVDKFKYITGNGNLPNNDAVVTITVGADISFTTTNVDPSCNGGSNGSITFNASGGNGTLQYSITGAAGTYQSSNIFTGLNAGTYNLAVKDQGGLIKTGTTTLNNPLAIVVNGTTPVNIVYNTAMTTVNYTRTNSTGASTWSATGLPSGLSINSTTGDLTGTPTITGSFNASINVVDVNGCTGSKSVVINVAPKLSNDAYTVVGNTQLVANAHSSPATPFTADATNILTNDQSNTTITITAGTFATANGGSITIDAAGKFTYTPKNGSNTADSYIYTATSAGVSATATISFTVSNMVWYVNNTFAGGNGSSNTPYQDLTSASTAAQANQIIYVHTGSGNTTGNATLKSGQTLRGNGSALAVGALSLLAGTKPTLSGTVTPASSVTVDGFDMSTGTNTAITSTGATSVAVNIGNVTSSGAVNAVSLTNTTGSVIIAGGTQTNTTGPSFTISGGTVSLTYSGNISQAANAAMVSVSGGHATGTILFQTGTLSATNGTGLQFDNADGTYTFSGTTTLNGGDAGIDIVNGSLGTFSFPSTTTSITNPTNEVIRINASAANVTYSGTFSKTSAGTGILVNGETSGTITINGTGTKTLSTSTGNAVSLTSNTGATINFSGNNLLLTTTTGTGFNATGGGTISVAGTGNTISSPTGTALNVNATTISATGLNFQSISSNAAATTNGIILINTGSSGGLTVTGTGSAASGGTISSKNGTDGNSATQGTGIYLNNCRNISLSWMNIQGCQNYGIRGITVSTFALNNSTIGTTTKNGSAYTDVDASTAVSGEGSLRFLDLTGTCSISGCTLDNGFTRTVFIHNEVSTPLNVTVSGSTINQSLNAGNGGDGNTADAMFLQGSNASSMTMVFSNNTVSAYRQFGILTDARNTSTMDITVANCNFSNGNTGNANASCSINFSGSGDVATGGNIFVKYYVHDNIFRHGTVASTPNNGGAHIVSGGASGRATFYGKIINNTFGVSGVPFSGAGNGADVLRLFQSGSNNSTIGNTRYLVQGNTIQRYGEVGIQVNSRQSSFGSSSGAGGIDITIIGNTIREPGTAAQGAFGAIWVNAGVVAADNNTVNIAIGGTGAGQKNTMTDSDPSNATDIFLDSNTPAGGSKINLYRNGATTVTGTGETLVKNILIEDNNATLDLLGGFTNSSNIGIVAGLPAQPPLKYIATRAERKSVTTTKLTEEELHITAKQAIEIWKAKGLDAESLKKLENAVITTGELNEGELGRNTMDGFMIGADADGKGWIIEDAGGQDNHLYKVDLLTVVLHEMGHILGLEDLCGDANKDDLMYEGLTSGQRKLPSDLNLKTIQAKKQPIKTF